MTAPRSLTPRAELTPDDPMPIYNVWDDSVTILDAWTYSRPAALRLARFAAWKHRAEVHVTEYAERLAPEGYIITDPHSHIEVATFTPQGATT